MLAAPAAPSWQPPRPDGRGYVVSAASDPTVTSHACADRLLRTEAQVLLRYSFPVSNNHQRDFTSHAPTTIHPAISHRAPRIACSPNGCATLATCSAFRCWPSHPRRRPILQLRRPGLARRLAQRCHIPGTCVATSRYETLRTYGVPLLRSFNKA